NFASAATVDLEDLTEGLQFYNRTVSSRSGTTAITINPNFGTLTTSWRVRVNNDSTHSNWFTFTVVPRPRVATPVPNPGSTTFPSSLSVTATTATPGAVIRYTIDGTTPQ